MTNIIKVEGGYKVEGSEEVYETKAQATKARVRLEQGPVETKKPMPKHTKRKVAKKAVKKATRKRK